MTEALLPLPRPPRLPWAAIVVLAFLAGALGGAAAAVAVVRRTVRHAVANPQYRTERATRMLTRRLDLDAAQQERVRAILESQASDLGRLRREVWPRVLERLDSTEREISETLTPSQRETFRGLVARLRKNWIDAHPPPAK